MAFAIWLIWGGLTMSLALPLLRWPVMFIGAGGFVAAALISVSITVPKLQLEQAPKSFRCLLILAVSLGFGMFLQTVPLKFTGFTNPLWSAMGAAIGQPTAGYITVDTARTVIALAEYLVILGAGQTVALSCTSQMRSAQMLYAIAWLLTIFCVACLIKVGVNEFQSAEMKERFWEEWINLSMLGVLTTASIMVRFQMHHASSRLSSKPWPSGEYFRSFALWAVMIFLFAFPLFAQGPQATTIPAVCGISTLLAVAFVKRLAFGMAGVLFAVALVICGLWLAGLTTGIIGPSSPDVLGSRSETEIATAVRVFRDFRGFGSGAGTYSLVVPIYADLNDGGKGLFDSAPTALSLLIELGMPLTLLAAILLLALAWAVFSTVARNGRDYSQAMLACSALVYVVAAAFTPGASLSFATTVIASVLIGLGLAGAQRPLGIPSASHSRFAARPRSTSGRAAVEVFVPASGSSGRSHTSDFETLDMHMPSLLRVERFRFLLLGLAIICALIWTAYVTGYDSDGGLDSVDKSSSLSNIVDIGAIQDPVALSDLWPVDSTAFRADQLFRRLSPEKWAAVKSAAEKSIAASPLNSRMWLVLAIAEVARHSERERAVAALKMSYFTAPNDVTITEPRFALSLELGVLSDSELTAAVRRDIRNLFLSSQKLRIVLLRVYCHALPEGRAVIDDLARELKGALAGTWYRDCGAARE